jgi:hypothetical protein
MLGRAPRADPAHGAALGHERLAPERAAALAEREGTAQAPL